MRLLVGLAVGALLAGCSSVGQRISQRQAEFNALDAVSQENIRNGQVDLGYTPDMVYMALGEPTRREQRLSPKGVLMVWYYKDYYQEPVGTADVALHRQIIYNPRTRTYAILMTPVPVEAYALHAEDKVKIEFLNGKVSAVEQDKDA